MSWKCKVILWHVVWLRLQLNEIFYCKGSFSLSNISSVIAWCRWRLTKAHYIPSRPYKFPFYTLHYCLHTTGGSMSPWAYYLINEDLVKKGGKKRMMGTDNPCIIFVPSYKYTVSCLYNNYCQIRHPLVHITTLKYKCRHPESLSATREITIDETSSC